MIINRKPINGLVCPAIYSAVNGKKSLVYRGTPTKNLNHAKSEATANNAEIFSIKDKPSLFPEYCFIRYFKIRHDKNYQSNCEKLDKDCKELDWHIFASDRFDGYSVKYYSHILAECFELQN